MLAWLNRQNYRSTWFWARASALAIIAYFLFLWKAFWSPDALFVIFLVIFSLFGQSKQYVLRFAPFALLLLTYDSFRSLVPFLNKHVHFTEMIRFDRWLGHGVLPTNQLQHWLYHGSLRWYDFYFYALYMAHFLGPFILAILIWKLRPRYYWTYATALITLSYAGFLTYLIFPAAPPWMASDMGLIPHVQKLSTDIWWNWGVHNFPTIYHNLNPNPVAAVPSLHAAYPMLDLLFVWKLFGRKAGAIFAIYPLSLWFGVVYLGEHYAFDVLLGMLYAVITFYGVQAMITRHWTIRRLWHKSVARARPAFAQSK
jgi:hypothetical protein